MRALAQRLRDAHGWRTEERRLAFRTTELLTNLLLRVTLAGLRRADSDRLEPPWPDLVITAGRRNEPVARWIRRRAGGQARIVHLGRPWTPPGRFDLVISTPQYFLEPGANVLVNDLPLHRPLPAATGDREHWQSTAKQALPRPWVCVLVGGDSGAQVMSAGDARGIIEQAAPLAGHGTLLVTTSRRTPSAAVEALDAALQEHVGAGVLHRYGAEGPNPYRGWLRDADCFVVTVDSMSMLAEAATTGRPLWLAATGSSRGRPWWLTRPGWGWKPMTHRLAQRLAPRRLRRDTGRMIDRLLEAGRARWLGSAGDFAAVRDDDELERSAARVAALLDPPGGQAAGSSMGG